MSAGPEPAAPRRALRQAIETLCDCRRQLEAILHQLRRPPDLEARLVYQLPYDQATEVLVAVECALEDNLGPAIEALERAEAATAEGLAADFAAGRRRFEAALTAYQRTIERAVARVRERRDRLLAERAEAWSLLDELLAQPEVRRQILVHNRRRYRTWGLCDLLLQRSQAEEENPAQARHLARLALAAASGLDCDSYGERFVHDVKALAAAYLADAERRLGSLSAARLTLKRARTLAESGTLDPWIGLQVERLTALLERDLEQWDEALRRLEAVMGHYVRAGEGHLAAGVLVDKALVLRRRGDEAGAAAALREALTLLTPGVDPQLEDEIRGLLAAALGEAGAGAS